MAQAYDSAGKRAALVRAAKELFYHQGFQRTSLEHVAQGAGVPLGNVHYYFSTKRALALAVLDSHKADLAVTFAAWDAQIPRPQERLVALLRSPLQASEAVVRYGCPHGSLCQELEKSEDQDIILASSELLSVWVRWSQDQLELLGWPSRAAQRKATQLVSVIQGSMLLAHTLHSEETLSQQLGEWEVWLDQEIRRGPAKENPA